MKNKMAKIQQKLSSLIKESQGNIAERFDKLDDTTRIVIFETSREIGIYRDSTNSQDIGNLRTRVSGEESPKIMAFMSKRAFYRQNILTALCASEIKKDRPLNYYGI